MKLIRKDFLIEGCSLLNHDLLSEMRFDNILIFNPHLTLSHM